MQSLSLTDGTNTVTLSGDGGTILQASYIPQPGEPGGTVLEDAVIVCEGTAAELQTVVRSINQLFALARRRQGSGRTDRVYIQYQNEGDASAWRAEVINGSLSWSDNWMRRQFHASNDTPVEMILSWERESEWEGPSTALAWGAGGSASININNGDSGTNYNAADVEDDSIVGELPAPVVLNIENNSGTDVAWRNFYVSNDGDMDFSGNEHQFTHASSKTIGAGENHTTLQWISTLGTPSKFKGEFFRVIAAFTSSSTGIYYRANVYHVIGGSYLLLESGPEVYNTRGGAAMELMDLGAVALPPGGQGFTVVNLRLVITARSTAGGTATLDFLQVQFAPQFAHAEQQGYSMADGGAITLDEVEQRYYASGDYNIVNKRGARLSVFPNQSNRFLISFDESGNQYVPGRGMTISGSYRPRRLTL